MGKTFVAVEQSNSGHVVVTEWDSVLGDAHALVGTKQEGVQRWIVDAATLEAAENMTPCPGCQAGKAALKEAIAALT